MYLPFQSWVRKTLNRADGSWERTLDCKHSVALLEFAYRAPHAPSESRSRFAFDGHRSKFGGATLDCDGLNGLRLTTSDVKHSSVKAAGTESNRPDRSAPKHVHKNQVLRRMWSYRVTEVSCGPSNHRTLRIVECLRVPVSKYEIRAQFGFELSVNEPLVHPIQETPVRPIQHTIRIQLLLEPAKFLICSSRKDRDCAERPRTTRLHAPVN